MAIGLGLRVLRCSSALVNLFEMSRMRCSSLALPAAAAGKHFDGVARAVASVFPFRVLASSSSPRKLVSDCSCCGPSGQTSLPPYGVVLRTLPALGIVVELLTTFVPSVSPSFLLALCAWRSHSDVALDAAATGPSVSRTRPCGNRL